MWTDDHSVGPSECAVPLGYLSKGIQWAGGHGVLGSKTQCWGSFPPR